MSLIIEARDITKFYGPRKILDFESLHIYRGEKVGIVGANGAGKTTLLDILSGALPPDSGRVVRHATATYLPQFHASHGTLSGGESQKQEVLRLQKAPPGLIIADEPTANLDAKGVRWVRQQLERGETLLLVSHDRQLLDDLCTRIVEVKDGELTSYGGNYSFYQEQLELQQQQAQQAYDQAQTQRRQLERAVQAKERQRQQSDKRANAFKKTNESEARLGKFRLSIHRKQLDREKKVLEGRLDRMEEVASPKEAPRPQLDFGLTHPPHNHQLIQVRNLSFGYGERVLFDDVSFSLQRGERLALTGANGSGKTTLLEQIAQGNPAVYQVPKVKLGYLRQNFSQLEPEQTVMENVLSTNIQAQETVHHVLAGLLFTGVGLDKPAKVLSGGERVRLGLAKLILSDINTLMLDEPTNFLDIPSLQALEQTLVDYPGAVLFVSHDEQFVENVATRKLEIREGKVLAPGAATPAVKVDKLALELQQTRLAVQLETASKEKVAELEKEYFAIARQLRELKK